MKSLSQARPLLRGVGFDQTLGGHEQKRKGAAYNSDGNAKASAREGDEIGAELMGGNFWTMPRTIWSMAGAGVRL